MSIRSLGCLLQHTNRASSALLGALIFQRSYSTLPFPKINTLSRAEEALFVCWRRQPRLRMLGFRAFVRPIADCRGIEVKWFDYICHVRTNTNWVVGVVSKCALLFGKIDIWPHFWGHRKPRPGPSERAYNSAQDSLFLSLSAEYNTSYSKKATRAKSARTDFSYLSIWLKGKTNTTART